MRQLLNTLFVTSEDIYLTLDGENVVANREKVVAARYPLHTLSAIITFSYSGASPALMGACAQRGISLSVRPVGNSWPGLPANPMGMFCFVVPSTGLQMIPYKAVFWPAT